MGDVIDKTIYPSFIHYEEEKLDGKFAWVLNVQCVRKASEKQHT